jgi:hypothetical protein
VGDMPESPMQTAPSASEKKIWEQSWFRWCEVFATLWGVLTPIYAGLQHFLKFAPVWDAGGGAPRWFDLIVTYFCIPVALLGVYAFCIALLALIPSLFTFSNRAKFYWYQIVLGIPLGTIALGYILSSDTPGIFLITPFIFGLSCIFFFATGMVHKATQRR